MFIINTSTKKFTEAAELDLGMLPAQVKIDFALSDGSEPVEAENHRFKLTIGDVVSELYKTDEDTVSFRYVPFDSDTVAATKSITIEMDGEQILSDTIALTYTEPGGGNPFPVGGVSGQVLTKTSEGETWDDVPSELPATGDNGNFLQKTASGAQWTAVPAQEQADWDESDSAATSYIKNKPDVIVQPSVAGTTGQVLTKTADGQEWANPTGGSDPDVITSLNNTIQILTNEVGTISNLNYFHMTAKADSVIEFVGENKNSEYEYSFDRASWKQFKRPYLIVIPSGYTVWIRALANRTQWDFVNDPIFKTSSTGNISVGGELLSLVSKDLDTSTNYGGSKRYHSIFRDCEFITEIESNFRFITAGYTDGTCDYAFRNCKNLQNLPSNFALPSGSTNYSCCFDGCKAFTTIPAGCMIPTTATDVSYYLSGCTNLASLPAGFTIPSGVTNTSNMFNQCALTAIPDGFTIPASVTTYAYMFANISSLVSIGNNVSINPSDSGTGGLNHNNITTIGTNFSYKTAYTTNSASGQAVFPNATIGSGWHIYQYSDGE